MRSVLFVVLDLPPLQKWKINLTHFLVLSVIPSYPACRIAFLSGTRYHHINPPEMFKNSSRRQPNLFYSKKVWVETEFILASRHTCNFLNLFFSCTFAFIYRGERLSFSSFLPPPRFFQLSEKRQFADIVWIVHILVCVGVLILFCSDNDELLFFNSLPSYNVVQFHFISYPSLQGFFKDNGCCSSKIFLSLCNLRCSTRVNFIK